MSGHIPLTWLPKYDPNKDDTTRPAYVEVGKFIRSQSWTNKYSQLRNPEGRRKKFPEKNTLIGYPFKELSLKIQVSNFIWTKQSVVCMYM